MQVLNSVSQIRGKILFIDKKGNYLLYRGFSFYYFNVKSHKSELIYSGSKLFVYKWISNKRLISRFFRIEPRCIEQLSDNIYLITFLHRLWILDIQNKTMTIVFQNRKGFSDPLNFCKYNECIYWGEYGNNPLEGEVNIYRIDQNLNVSIVYTFPKHSVRHIHNIIFDELKNIFWILTGDNESKSGIYIADENWNRVIPVVIGKQKYRAVIGFPTSNGLIYATDSVNSENFIYEFSLSKKTIVPITSLNGSCIYGCENKEFFFFSTTVEPPEGRNLFDLLSTKLGAGIKSKDVCLLAIQKCNMKVYSVAQWAKDIYPMKLFQYGAITFPHGQKNLTDLWCYPIACKNVDGKNIHFSFYE